MTFGFGNQRSIHLSYGRGKPCYGADCTTIPTKARSTRQQDISTRSYHKVELIQCDRHTTYTNLKHKYGKLRSRRAEIHYFEIGAIWRLIQDVARDVTIFRQR